MIQSIIKRDGRVVLYDQNKIAAAILRAMEAAKDGDAADAARVANDVQRDLESRVLGSAPDIEAIQDSVERQLMNHGFNAAAKAYILYRANRTRAREANTSLMKTIDEITNIDARISDMKRDNANIDGNTAMGSMLQIGSAGAKAYNEMYLLRPGMPWHARDAADTSRCRPWHRQNRSAAWNPWQCCRRGWRCRASCR